MESRIGRIVGGCHSDQAKNEHTHTEPARVHQARVASAKISTIRAQQMLPLYRRIGVDCQEIQNANAEVPGEKAQLVTWPHVTPFHVTPASEAMRSPVGAKRRQPYSKATLQRARVARPQECLYGTVAGTTGTGTCVDARNLIGSTLLPCTSTSKWRCGAVASPLAPTAAIAWPMVTLSPR